MNQKPHITFQGTAVLKERIQQAAAEMGLPESEILRRAVHHGISAGLHRKPIPKKSRVHER